MKNIRKRILSIIVILVITLSFFSRVVYAALININNDLNHSWIKSKPIAHRGLYNDVYPENSLGAFNNAVKSSYAIELDVHFTKDKQVVVIHDENLERLTGKNTNLRDITYDELKELTLNGSKESIPLLSQVLKEVNSKEPILIEIKSDDDVILLGKAVYEELQGYNGKYAIQSFNPAVIQWYANNAPHVTRGILIGSLKDKKNLIVYNKYIISNDKKPNFISMDLAGVDDTRIQELRQRGIMVLCWTVRNKGDIKKTRVYSDNIIFDSFIPDKAS